MFRDLFNKVLRLIKPEDLSSEIDRLIRNLNNDAPRVRNAAMASLRKLRHEPIGGVARVQMMSILESADRFHNAGSCGPGRTSEEPKMYQPYQTLISELEGTISQEDILEALREGSGHVYEYAKSSVHLSSLGDEEIKILLDRQEYDLLYRLGWQSDDVSLEIKMLVSIMEKRFGFMAEFISGVIDRLLAIGEEALPHLFKIFKDSSISDEFRKRIADSLLEFNLSPDMRSEIRSLLASILGCLVSERISSSNVYELQRGQGNYRKDGADDYIKQFYEKREKAIEELVAMGGEEAVNVFVAIVRSILEDQGHEELDLSVRIIKALEMMDYKNIESLQNEVKESFRTKALDLSQFADSLFFLKEDALGREILIIQNIERLLHAVSVHTASSHSLSADYERKQAIMNLAWKLKADGDKRIEPFFRGLLDSAADIPTVLEALKILGNTETIPTLKKKLNDENFGYKKEMSFVLAFLGEFEPLLSLLKSTQDPYEIADTIDVLSKIKIPETIIDSVIGKISTYKGYRNHNAIFFQYLDFLSRNIKNEKALKVLERLHYEMPFGNGSRRIKEILEQHRKDNAIRD